MLLIEAINIRQGGGKVLLDYLLEELNKRKVPFSLLQSAQYQSGGNFGKKTLRFNPGVAFSRDKLIKAEIERTKPSVVFCFCNFPPGFRAKDGAFKTVTYFHTPLFFNDADLSNFSLKNKLILKFKKLFLRLIAHYSDFYVVQSEIIKKRFVETFNYPAERCLIIPFFDIDKIRRIKANMAPGLRKNRASFIFPSSPSKHKNHENLLNAWEILLNRNVKPVLQLTIPSEPFTAALRARIENLNERGAKIINLGARPFADLMADVYQCEYVIFPSFEETLGLGLVEGSIMDCKVLASDRPYTYEVVVPSGVFDPENPEDMANAIEKAVREDLPMPRLVIANQVDTLINLLTNA